MAVEDNLDIFGADPFGRDTMYGLSTGRDSQGLAPYGFRYAESVSQPVTAKGRGYLGNVGTMQEPITELSASSDFGGRTVRYPLVVPTLNADELNLLRSGGEPTQEIYGKAQQYALGRLARGEDPFATPQDLRYPQPQAVDTRPYDRMQATPRSFISGLFSDVLGRTLNMPLMPRTGIPSLDLLYANRNPLFNLMGVGDVQKTAERISYGEPLTTGSGMTTKPREETLFAGMAVAPLVGEAVNLGARAGRAGARMVGQGIAENVARGRSSLPSLLAEPRSSLFAVEPSPMMPKPQAPVSELGFYSAAEQAALNLPRNKGTGQAFLNDLMKAPDVKKDELSWIGLDDFLKDKPNVTKQEVQDFIANNKVDLQEVRLGEPPFEDPAGIAKRKAIFDKYEPEIQQLYKDLDDVNLKTRNAVKVATAKYDEMLYQLNKEGYMPTAQDYEAFNLAEKELTQANRMRNDDIDIRNRLSEIQSMRDAEADAAYVVPERVPTKYSKYQLPLGENYREILLRLPNIKGSGLSAQESQRLNDLVEKRVGSSLAGLTDAEQQEYFALIKKREESASGYKSSHWDEPNILAHMRVNDRIDADGKKMLLVEEIQSDWHQAGREKGYKSQTRSTSEIQKDLDSVLAELRSKPNVSYAPSEDDWARYPEITNRYDSLAAEFDAAKQNKGVPDAPFKDTWYQLALKRIMKYAADNGYERVGLTTGKRQIERFSDELRQNVDEINFSSGYPNKQTTTITATKDGQPTFEGNVVDGKFIDGVAKGKTIDEVLGKSIAQKIQSHDQSQGLGTIKGNDLTIGGEGMKKYYDEIYPKYLEKYGKKWDASVGETKIKTGQGKQGGEPVRYIDITPKMKESVGKGQPLFTAIPAGTLGLGGLEYTDPFANPLAEDTTR